MRKLLALAFLFSATLLFISCGDDEGNDPTFSAPEIEAVSSAISQLPGEVAIIQLAVAADAGIQSIEVSGATLTEADDVSFVAGDNSQVVSYDFTVPADAAEGATYELTFTVTDSEGETASDNVVVTASATPSRTIELGTGVNGLADIAASDGWDEATSTLTLTANNTYILDGFVFVQSGQTIEIEAGTIIKGRPGQGGGASALVVTRGAQIFANGTAESPIIMTGLADDLNGSVPDDAEALWGGLILLGNAPSNNLASDGLRAIEGLPTEGLLGDPLYGGTNAADNSGVVRYVSIRHGGSLIGGDNEINGFTLGGVGTGTTIEYVEVFSNLDDGIEWFGGTANGKYLVSSWVGDDGLDSDEGYSGKLQFGLVWANESNVKDDSWNGEHDGGIGSDEGSMPFSLPKFYNITSIGADGLLGVMLIRDNSGITYANSIFSGFELGIDLEIRGGIESSYDRFTAGDLELKNNIFHNVAEGTPETIFTIITAGTVSDGDRQAAQTALTNYFTSAGNLVSDPGFNGVVPANNAAVTTGLADAGDTFFTSVNYKGAFEPGQTPWIAGWTKTWEVLNQ